MRLVAARKLKSGDHVMVDDVWGKTHEATVVHVTAKGGVLLAVNGGKAWVPYSRVHRAKHLTVQRASR